MKKVIKFFALMAAIALILPGISIFALEDNGNYDDVDNSTVSNKDKLIHVEIRDADGKIVESYEIDRTTYVNGTQHTIPAGGSYLADTYYASMDFTAGFFFVHPNYTGYATTRDREITVVIRKGTSVHGTRKNAKQETFSTNIENNTSSEYFFSGEPAWSSGVELSVTPSGGYYYYDVIYYNNSTSPTTVSVLISRD